jgi:hypothetical protein
MEVLIVTMLLPELLVLVLGLIGIVYCVFTSGVLLKLQSYYKPRSKRVNATYWGGYTNLAAVSGKSGSPAMDLPRITPVREQIKYEPDWTG